VKKLRPSCSGCTELSGGTLTRKAPAEPNREQKKSRQDPSTAVRSEHSVPDHTGSKKSSMCHSGDSSVPLWRLWRKTIRETKPIRRCGGAAWMKTLSDGFINYQARVLLSPALMVSKKYPHGEDYRGGHAQNAIVTGARESLARFDPPAQIGDHPSPPSGPAAAAARRGAGRRGRGSGWRGGAGWLDGWPGAGLLPAPCPAGRLCLLPAARGWPLPSFWLAGGSSCPACWLCK